MIATFNYAFDDIGNRKSAGSGTPGAQRTQTYGVNLLNQYTNRTVPGYLEVNGSADAAASVTVNGASPSRQGEYYRQEVSVNNVSAGLVQWLTSRATNTTGTSIVARLSFVPQTPEAFVHDADGNLTQDGLWTYTWDGENRLTRIETRTNAITDSNYWQRLDATYDYQSRRVRKQVFAWNPGTGSYQLSTSLRFFYDGWNLVGQVDEVTGTRLSFVWGSDLSGSMQGAGGVGGLKALIVHNGSLAGTYFYSYDGNGNVAALVNAADGTEAARYEYGPFLELLRATGPLARLNPFRASTKYHDDETDLLYYGYRYLSTVTGRWLSKDPLGEFGGDNLYSFAYGNPISWWDLNGLLMPDRQEEFDRLNPRIEISRNDYWHRWQKDNPNRDISLDPVREGILNQGCVGVACNTLGKRPFPDLSKCYKTLIKAQNRQAEMVRKKECQGLDCNKEKAKPIIFSLHFYTNRRNYSPGRDGTVDLSYWETQGRLGRQRGEWNNFGLRGGMNYDYGLFNPSTGRIIHGNHFHDPLWEYGRGPMLVYDSSMEKWTESNSDFDDEVWCVECNTDRLK